MLSHTQACGHHHGRRSVRRRAERTAMTDDDLITLFHAIALGDRAATLGALHTHAGLATASLERGATRQEAVEFFLDDIQHHVYQGDTALHVAAAAYDTTIVNELLTTAARVDAANRRGAQPLHYAVDGGPNARRFDESAQCAVMKSLLEHGADVDARDKNGTTPLLRAVRNRCAGAVQTLIDADADLTITNAKGSTAAHLARVTSGRGGTGTPAARVQQERIIEMLDAATR
jgi:ankyrin repeat protein